MMLHLFTLPPKMEGGFQRAASFHGSLNGFVEKKILKFGGVSAIVSVNSQELRINKKTERWILYRV